MTRSGFAIAEKPTEFYLAFDVEELLCGFDGCDEPAVWYCDAVSFVIRGKTDMPLGEGQAILPLCTNHVATMNVYGDGFELDVRVGGE